MQGFKGFVLLFIIVIAAIMLGANHVPSLALGGLLGWMACQAAYQRKG